MIEDVELDGDGVVVVSVRPQAGERGRCPHCRRRCAGYDWGEGRRRWRALDLGTTLCFVEAEAPRVSCRRHGVVVAAVPWARHDSRFTRAFEDQVSWLAVNTSKAAVAALIRIAWRSVGWICARVTAEARSQRDLFGGLKRLGFDEISIRKGQRYLTVVVDHDSGRLVWAAPGRTARRSSSSWTCWAQSVARRSRSCPATWPSGSPARSRSAARTPRSAWTRFMSPSSQSTRWTRSAARSATRRARPAKPRSRTISRARFALWKNPEHLTRRQHAKLSQIKHTNEPLYRVYLLKEQLRAIYRVPTEHASALLDAWLAWARRSRLEPFVKLARTITDHRSGIEAAVEHGLSNACAPALIALPFNPVPTDSADRPPGRAPGKIVVHTMRCA